MSNENYEWNDHDPKCPWCHEEQGSRGGGDPFPVDCAGEDFDCENCGKKFKVTDIDYQYRTEQVVTEGRI